MPPVLAGQVKKEAAVAPALPGSDFPRPSSYIHDMISPFLYDAQNQQRWSTKRPVYGQPPPQPGTSYLFFLSLALFYH